MSDEPAIEPAADLASYRVTRFAILRLLGLVYLVAFLILALQGPALIGHSGLTPADAFLAHLAEHYGSRSGGFFARPSLFWLGCSDRALVGLAWLGVILSLLLLAGFGNALVLLLLWMLYSSFVRIGQVWYGYGWDIQLCETGFLAVFLCPLIQPELWPRPERSRPPPPVIIWLFRWLAFRIMLGAGLIKLRGADCWRDLTCLVYHFETQPNPHPLSPLFHALPIWAHKAGVLFNHLCEVVLPWFAFGPRRARLAAGAGMVAFQLLLIASGNLAFLNWLTLVPLLACFDDRAYLRVLPGRLGRWLRAEAGTGDDGPPTRHVGDARWGWFGADLPQRAVVAAFSAAVVLLSIEPALNLISREQRMNATFDRLMLVNTYGAFGSIGKERNEIVFEGTDEAVLTPATRWRPYEFKCKPGDVARRPCLITPYHYRLDWQAWFAAMTRPERAPWTVHFVWKLLHNDRAVLGLLARNPFPDRPPRYVRALYYRYRFAPLGARDYWQRQLLGTWLVPLSVDDPRLSRFLAANGWLPAGEAEADSKAARTTDAD